MSDFWFGVVVGYVAGLLIAALIIRTVERWIAKKKGDPKCYGGAAHNQRFENGDRYTDTPQVDMHKRSCEYRHKELNVEPTKTPSEPCPKCGCADKVQAGDMSVHECDKCYTAWETVSEPVITVAEHKAKMRELLEEIMPMCDGSAYKEKLYRKYSLAEPTPAERVTVGIAHGDVAVYYVDNQIAPIEQIKAALIAQLEKESHD